MYTYVRPFVGRAQLFEGREIVKYNESTKETILGSQAVQVTVSVRGIRVF